ncbi:MAG TPA: 50S ribosomal protein L25/general stress protein Ctc [Mycobacteriales bacterium]|nr:50S ribosomal protein L25/general stress protein Ctc [Mycobacteriales bacterium]
MSEVRIPAEQRTKFGKGGARRTRREGKVPAVLYGHGTDVRHISLPARELMHAFKHEGANVLLSLDIEGGGTELALPRQIQRDPLRGDLTHVDLLVVKRGEKVSIDVPIHTVGILTTDGLLDFSIQTLNVEAEATHLPTGFEVDLSKLKVGQSVHARDIKLPEGVTLLVDPDTVMLHVTAAPSVEQVEAELAEAEADLGAGAAGAAALAAEAAEEAGETADTATSDDNDGDGAAEDGDSKDAGSKDKGE